MLLLNHSLYFLKVVKLDIQKRVSENALKNRRFRGH
jgi:hypothetical protein